MEDSKPKVVHGLMLYQDKAQTPLVPSIHPLQLDWPRPVHNPWACPMKGPQVAQVGQVASRSSLPWKRQRMYLGDRQKDHFSFVFLQETYQLPVQCT